MSEINVATSEQVAQLVRHCLEEGQRVEIDGLGVFERDSRGGYKFTALSPPKVFLGYVVTVAPKNGAIMAGRKGPAMWLRYGQRPAKQGQM